MPRNKGAGPPGKGDSASLFFPFADPGPSVGVYVGQPVQPFISIPGPATPSLTARKPRNRAAHHRLRCWEFRPARPTLRRPGAGPDPGALIGQMWGGAGTLLRVLLRLQKLPF